MTKKKDTVYSNGETEDDTRADGLMANSMVSECKSQFIIRSFYVILFCKYVLSYWSLCLYCNIDMQQRTGSKEKASGEKVKELDG
jgi:hypothetical protein